MARTTEQDKVRDCNERSTGRPRPTPGGGSTRSMTRSTAGTSWSARGRRCAPIAARPASTVRPSPTWSSTGPTGCSTSWPETYGTAATARSPRAGCSSRSLALRSAGRCRSRRQELNRFLRGWSGYFRYGNSTKAFDKIRSHAINRMALFVARRHGRPPRWGWSLVVYRSSDLMGLLNVNGTVVAPRPLWGWRRRPNAAGEGRR